MRVGRGCRGRGSESDTADLARMINPVLRGWLAYYGRFYRSALYPLFDRINDRLMRWIRKKYRISVKQACRRMVDGHDLRPDLASASRRGDQNDKSHINREVYVRFCGSQG